MTIAFAAPASHAGRWGRASSATMLGAVSRRPTRLQVAPARTYIGTEWLTAVLDRLEEIALLRHGWNGSPEAVPPGPETLVRALEALAEFMPHRAVAPQTVATPEGGVRFEWHAGQMDVVVEVEPHGAVDAWGEDHVSGEAWEASLQDALPRLEGAVEVLTSRVRGRS